MARKWSDVKKDLNLDPVAVAKIQEEMIKDMEEYCETCENVREIWDDSWCGDEDHCYPRINCPDCNRDGRYDSTDPFNI